MVIVLMHINTSYMMHNMKTRMLHAMQNLLLISTLAALLTEQENTEG